MKSLRFLSFFVALMVVGSYANLQKHFLEKEEIVPQIIQNEEEGEGEGEGDEGEEEGEEDVPGINIILFIFICLFLGSALKHLQIYIKVPYSPILLILGFILGIISKHLGELYEAIDEAHRISPKLIALIFLPALIFDSAFSMSWHIFRKEFGKILLLAGPGVLINAFLTAAIFSYILRYNDQFTFAESLLFGSILGATDPVAVVSLLKELGASKTLATLIEGESLLNDGSAIVLFEVVEEIVEGQNVTAGHVTTFFLRLAFGGVGLGLAFAIVSTFWLSLLFRKPIIEMCIVFITPYLLYYVCECTTVHVSGVLALVTLGVFMSGFGKTKISPESEQDIHTLWTFFGFAAETIIFLLSGAIVGRKIEHLNLHGKDWGCLVALYFVLHVVRAIMIGVFYYPLKRYGYGFTWQKFVVVVYGGLRGAVGLALALTVYNSNEINVVVRDKILFFTAFLATLTIIINGSTAGFIVQHLGLTKETKSQLNIYTQIIQHLFSVTDEVINTNLKSNRFLNVVEWNQVKELVCTKQYIKALTPYYTTKDKKKHKCFSVKMKDGEILFKNKIKEGDLNVKKLINQARLRFLTILKGIYWEKFEEGNLSSSNIINLIESVDFASDFFKDPLKDWDYVESHFLSIKFLAKIKELMETKLIFQQRTMKHIVNCYQICASYISAHEETLEELKEFHFGNEVMEVLRNETNQNIARANDYFNLYLFKNFKSLIVQIQNIQGAQAVLSYQLQFAKHTYEKGFINENEFKRIKNAMDEALNKVAKYHESQDTSSTPQQLIQNLGFFKTFFPQDKLAIIIAQAQSFVKNENQLVFAMGEEVKFLYIIQEGCVRESNDSFEQVNYFGSFVGLREALLDKPSKVNARSSTLTQLIRIPFNIIEEFISLEGLEFIWKKLFYSIIQFYPNNFAELTMCSPNKISILQKEMHFMELEQGKTITITSGMILLKGLFTEQSKDDYNKKDNSSIFEGPSHQQMSAQLLAINKCQFLIFTPKAKELIQNMERINIDEKYGVFDQFRRNTQKFFQSSFTQFHKNHLNNAEIELQNQKNGDENNQDNNNDL
eukprot:TRINITY_DN2275_c0_g1_i7.p1 TRINITY_DN2275_c0_g1~~TRINITY_DN2275_c0_g1_i7.p1  ORF type:complete len:1063 (-),score=155.68 TRINITY_DN2275_c0_g1_i7:82-3270(-)